MLCTVSTIYCKQYYRYGIAVFVKQYTFGCLTLLSVAFEFYKFKFVKNYIHA
jgi:hypothetical protein